MLLFADSGSTKTDWLVSDLSGNEIYRTQSLGLNPYFVHEEQILNACSLALPDSLGPLDIQQVFFYGAGCGNDERREMLSQVIEDFFPVAIVSIYTDILGAARAIFQQQRGIAAILGTGSNACVYNGQTVYRKVHSLGYLLGDEGSGAFLGKEFLKRFFNGKLSDDFYKLAKKKLSPIYVEVMDNLYMQPSPSRYLASFTPFLYEHREHPDVIDILNFSFNEFFDYYLSHIPERKELPLGFCGSVAYFFQDVILKIALERKHSVVGFVHEPLSGILKYHMATSDFSENV
jgi:N-acetylglucosamine kinase-like BadF-type ATPase